MKHSTPPALGRIPGCKVGLNLLFGRPEIVGISRMLSERLQDRLKRRHIKGKCVVDLTAPVEPLGPHSGVICGSPRRYDFKFRTDSLHECESLRHVEQSSNVIDTRLEAELKRTPSGGELKEKAA